MAISNASRSWPLFSVRKELTKLPKELCPEILEEILSRLPTRCLTRLKCVSKSWFSLIDLNLRSRTHPSYMLGFFYVRPLYDGFHNHTFHILQNLPPKPYSDHEIIDAGLQFLPMSFNQDIIDSCNGLLLCRSIKIFCSRQSIFYYVCNPATERWDRLPNIPDNSRDFARLAFDPHVSRHYEVLWVRHCGAYSEFNIFSSKKRAHGWQTLISLQPIIELDIHFRCGGTYSKGALYMTSCGANGGHIVRYRLLQGRCTTIMLPPGYKPYDGKPFVGLLAGSVCCAELSASRLRIWVLFKHDNDDGKSFWMLKSNIIVQESNVVRPALAFHPFTPVVFVQGNQGFWSYDLSCCGEEVHIGGPEYVQEERDVGVALPYALCYVDILEKSENKFLTALCNLSFIGFSCVLIYFLITLMKWYTVLLFIIIYSFCRCL